MEFLKFGVKGLGRERFNQLWHTIEKMSDGPFAFYPGTKLYSCINKINSS